jgi:hypothetical protein
MKLVIDRFEGKFAVCQDCETNRMIDLDISILPEDAHSGDFIELNVSLQKGDEIKKDVQEIINSLWD